MLFRSTFARGSLDTIHGLVSSEWRRGEDGSFSLDFTIPANTHASVCFPCDDPSKVTESGHPMKGEPYRLAVAKTPTFVTELGSGTYHFRTKLTK